MIKALLDLFNRQCVWHSKDYDILVKFIKVAGIKDGVEYAQVEYEGNTSFVPLNELFIVRK
jgi:hypothetical protein